MDEMRFEDLLSMASEYAGLLQYVDSDNQPAGDWREFLESDELCILAAILATNTHLVEADFFRFLRNIDATLAEGSVNIEIIPTLIFIRKIDSWLIQLGKLSNVAATRAQDKISDVIENTLRGELGKLRIFLQLHNVEGAELFFQGLSHIWHSDGNTIDGQGDIKQFLKSNFYSFFNAVSFLQGYAADILLVSLGRSNHDPSIGLYIVFLRLFKKIQEKINDFTQRHLNFYYEDVLKIERQKFVPDCASLIFCPDTNGREIWVKKGTEFRAGLDANDTELIYAAENDLLVNDAKVCSLCTLYFSRNSLSSPENALPARTWDDGQARNFTTSAKLNYISDVKEKGVATTDGLQAHPLFGVPQRSKTKHLFEEARLGFAVASKVLMMKQGRRDITLTFKLENQTNDLDSFTQKLSRVLLTTEPDAFFKAFRHMFKIAFTSETGWLEIEEYLPLSHIVEENVEADSFSIKIHLTDSADAVVAYSADIHGEKFKTDLPVVKFTVNPDAYLYPYSFLRELVVREILIAVEVRGCTDVLIYNQLGQLSADAQFNPFGALPALGDYFIIGNYEAARKKLVEFEVDIDWSGLPQTMSGFEEHYRAYAMPFSNAVFKVNLAVLKDRKWIPDVENVQPSVNLFESGDASDSYESKKVGKRRRLSFAGLCKFSKPLENLAEEQFGYDAQAKNGFFKLTLGNPPYAFGHKDYPLALSKAMTDNAMRKRFGIFKFFMKALPVKPLPNSPYTPLVNAISINYKAVSSISLERVASAGEDQAQEKMFHLHPLGLEALSPKAYGAMHLVPQYEADGNLFIGVSATKLSGLLTLFFHLREDSLPEAGARTFKFEWHYLADNQWRKLEKFQVVSDTTNGFLSSGIVTLDIPADITRVNTIMPSEIFWIRVSVNDSHLHTLCSFYGVYAQALKVCWKQQAGNSLAHLAEKLPAGTIKEARFSMTGIREIHQIMSSFGGISPESDMQRTIRVSERLRHKNRAITPWDYERLILQQFPEIYKVKCFPCMTGQAEHRGMVKPGHLLIVLIPYPKEVASVNLQPMVNALLLREVRKFVEGVSSAFVKINVRNPAYEQIQVRCKIRLRQGVGRGFQRNELNQEVINYLSPWSPHGLPARFGWHIRCNDMQSHIQELSYVESVSGLSMLHIREGDDHRYWLSDTARGVVDGKALSGVKPAYPWSIAIPARHHLLEIVDDQGAWQPAKTGIAKLSIGNTFILSRGKQ